MGRPFDPEVPRGWKGRPATWRDRLRIAALIVGCLVVIALTIGIPWAMTG